LAAASLAEVEIADRIPTGAVIYYSLKTALKKPGEKKPEEKNQKAAQRRPLQSSQRGIGGRQGPGQTHPAAHRCRRSLKRSPANG